MADERKLTDLELERVLAEDLPMRELGAADRTRLDQLRAANAAFVAAVDVDAEVRDIRARAAALPARRRWWQLALPLGALVAAAAVLLVVVRRPKQASSEDDVQYKGDGITLVVHVATPTGSQQLRKDDVVHAGDRVRFEVGGRTDGFIAVIGIDGNGAATVYFPFGSHAPTALDAARGGLLPGAIELDATPGDEHLYAVHSVHPFSFDEVIAALRAGRELPDRVETAEVVLHKKPAK